MPIKLKRILWPTDFSALSLQAARYARGFRAAFGAELHIIHVVPPPLTPDVSVILPTEVPVAYSDRELVEACQRTLAKVVEEQFKDVPEVTHEVCFGNPWSTICTYAGDHDIDLIIVATHGRTGLQHVLIGSTAERIVQHAPCPVLVVKRDRKDFVTE